MPILHVRNVPERIYQRLQRLAAERNRSVSAEVITLIEGAMDAEEQRVEQLKLLENIRKNRYSFPEDMKVPEAWELIREDRDR